MSNQLIDQEEDLQHENELELDGFIEHVESLVIHKAMLEMLYEYMDNSPSLADTIQARSTAGPLEYNILYKALPKFIERKTKEIEDILSRSKT